MATSTKLKKAATVLAFTAGLLSCNHTRPVSHEPRAATEYENRFKNQFDALTRATQRINDLVEKDEKLKTAHYEVRVQFTTDVNEHYTIRSKGKRPHLEYIYPFAQLVGNLLEAKTKRPYDGVKTIPASRWPPELGQLVSNHLKPLHPNVRIDGTATSDNAPLTTLGDLIVRGYRASLGLKIVLPQEDVNLAEHPSTVREQAYAKTFEGLPKDDNLLAPESPGLLVKINPTPTRLICVMLHRGMTTGITPRYNKVTQADANAVEKIRRIISEELGEKPSK